MIKSRFRLCVYASVVVACTALFGAPSSVAAPGEPSVQAAIDVPSSDVVFSATRVSKPDGTVVTTTITCYGATGGPAELRESGLFYAAAAARVSCTGIMQRMDMTLTLYWNGQPWASGIDLQFSANAMVASAAGTCLAGGYHGTARGTLVPPAGFQPPSAPYAFSTPFVNLDCV